MMVSADLSLPSPSCEMVSPSMLMDPPADSIILNRARVSEDFPAPVRPTIPIFSPEDTLQSMPFSTRSRPSR